MKFYLFSCIWLSLMNRGFAQNINFPNTESTFHSSENTATTNTENTLDSSENNTTRITESTSNSSEKISTTSETRVKCPENMISSPWRPVAKTLECYCDYPFLPLPVNNTCFEHLKQGPCEPGNFLIQPLWKIIGDLPLPRCIPNPCLEDGLVPYNGTCRNIITQPLCERGLLYFREVTSVVICQSLVRYHVAIDAPSRRKCPPGSREDRNGKCQKKL